MRARDFTRSRILEILKADPTKTLRELCALTHQQAGNVMYHVRRLERAGLVTWLGSTKHERSRYERKPAGLPKLAEAQLQANINKVVEKALAKEAFRQEHDIIHDYRTRFSGYTLKAIKL